LNPRLHWILINLVLPLSPFALRVFINLMGPQGNISFSGIAELPELLFYSVFVCISILNLNLSAKKTNFESIIRLFLFILLVLDFVTLGLIYSKKIGPLTWKFTIAAAIIPVLMAPFYRQVYSRRPGNE
jgi:hypothetical protein